MDDISNIKCKIDNVYPLPWAVKLFLISLFGKKRFMQSSSNRQIYHAMPVASKSHDVIFIVSWSSFAQSVCIKIFSRKALTICVLQGIPWNTSVGEKYCFEIWDKGTFHQWKPSCWVCYWHCQWWPCKSGWKRHNSYNGYDLHFHPLNPMIDHEHLKILFPMHN